jgi:hypothetical protein
MFSLSRDKISTSHHFTLGNCCQICHYQRHQWALPGNLQIQSFSIICPLKFNVPHCSPFHFLLSFSLSQIDPLLYIFEVRFGFSLITKLILILFSSDERKQTDAFRDIQYWGEKAFIFYLHPFCAFPVLFPFALKRIYAQCFEVIRSVFPIKW